MPMHLSRVPLFLITSFALLGLVAPGAALADVDPAIGGIDPLTYHDTAADGPLPGDAMYTVEHEGVEYRFVSSDNLNTFSMSPSDYAPAFGALDPVRLASGNRTPGDPEIFSVIDGRVFLFVSGDSRDRWLEGFEALAPGAIAAFEGDPGPDLAESMERNTSKYLTKKGELGANGYDVVAYFPVGGAKPAKGSKQHTADYRGVTYRFTSAANLERFKQHPSHFEPAYGGWCAYAIAKEDYTKPNPKRFLIQNGRLLLFYDGFFGDTYKSWNEEGPEQLELDADRWWLEESGEHARNGG